MWASEALFVCQTCSEQLMVPSNSIPRLCANSKLIIKGYFVGGEAAQLQRSCFDSADWVIDSEHMMRVK